MTTSGLREHIVRTLVYYELFDHPLSEQELYFLVSGQSVPRADVRSVLDDMVAAGQLVKNDAFYARPASGAAGFSRPGRERLARRRLLIARGTAHLIKRFPFVRGVMLSGDISKGVTTSASDVDFVIITEPGRLWICRSALIAFKKIFLLNQRKYFCLNYFVASDHLSLGERDYYTATEIAHLLPLYNYPLFLRYLNANAWIRDYFPNYRASAFHADLGNNRSSLLQRVIEWPIRGAWADRLDARLMEFMRSTWKKRYPEYTDEVRERIFRCTPSESRAYGGNFSDKILSMYRKLLEEVHA
jgi:hypothetical protein